MKRTFIFALLAAAMCLRAFAGDEGMPPRAPMVSPGFDKMKSLVGDWVGKNGRGQPVEISYRLASDGSAILETIKPEDMISVYSPDGDRVMMTHYCAMHNQPRMRAAAPAAGARTLDFQFVDATNMKSPDDGHMHSLSVAFDSADHITETWTFHMAGKVNAEVFQLDRKK